jgi:hypothetical protein
MDTAILIFIAGAWSFFVSVLWLIIGWRAMKAHERLASSHHEICFAVRTYIKHQLNLKE